MTGSRNMAEVVKEKEWWTKNSISFLHNAHMSIYIL